MTAVALVAAKRTAIGTFLGGLSSLPAHQLGAAVIKQVLSDIQLEADDVGEVILGQVLTANCGQNPARQASIAGGLPHTVPAMTINRVCGSGLQSVMDAARLIKLGERGVVIAGGQESMSQSPHAQQLRLGQKFGDVKLIDTMVHDGLWDAFNDIHMGITAENIAEQFAISREAQDEFAFKSQSKAATALEKGLFKSEIVPIEIPQRKGEPLVVDTDENPRLTPLEKLATLKPAFKKDGTVTAANASSLNDGAAVVVAMEAKEAERRGLKPLALIKSYAVAGVDPAIMGTGPVPASEQALELAGWDKADLDMIEANEAFAAQAACVNQQMGWDTEKVNISGGAIALGHPIGASGTRCLVTLLHGLQRTGGKKGLVTLCIGGGMGVAMCVERI